jgi:3-methyl-2-oxobutanoate hydroxymethyltransferase
MCSTIELQTRDCSTPYNGEMNDRSNVTMHRIREMYAAGEKIAMLTCYDALFARVLDDARIDILLVGDSLGTVLQGHPTTLPISIDDMVYHTACAARGNRTAWLIADMPFGGYQESQERAVHDAVRLMQAGAQMVKLEGAGFTLPIIKHLVERGIPVCAHLGFTPQSVHALGGFRVQGRDAVSATKLRSDAAELAAAGVGMLVLEMVPAALAREVTQALSIPVIGIGAGVGCSGQVLVLHDMLGITFGKPARFVRNFLEGAKGIEAAVKQYVAEVKASRFPDDSQHSF